MADGQEPDASPDAAAAETPATGTGGGILVVVVNHDGGELTLRCLRSALSAVPPPGGLRVTLVDNASHDGVAERVRRQLPAVEVIESATNRGFAGGCNLGIARRRAGEHVALLNNDAVADPGWLEPLAAALDRDARVGAACPKILLERDPPVIDNAGTELTGGNRGVDRGHGHPDDGAFDVPGDAFAWCGAAVLLRAAYLDDIGGFDERLFLYSEDLDMSWRGRLAGWRYRYEPASVVHHAHAATTARRPEILRYYTLRNHLVVAARYAAPSAVVRAVFRSLGALALHAATDWRTASGRAGLRTRVRAFGGFVRMVPGIVRERRLRSRGAISAPGASAS